MKSRSNIQKGSIVWYWHKETEQWLRGKVITINKYYGPYMHLRGLWVKNRKTLKPYFVPLWQTAYPASEPKPDFKGYADWAEASGYWDKVRDQEYAYYSQRSTKGRKSMNLLIRLGFMPKR